MATTITFPAKLTPRAKRILERAAQGAKRMGADDFIGVEHIFLAILARSTRPPDASHGQARSG